MSGASVVRGSIPNASEKTQASFPTVTRPKQDAQSVQRFHPLRPSKPDTEMPDREGSVQGMRVLLLQGPVGPFFKALRHGLEADGVQTRQVVFNFADSVFAGKGPKGSIIRYRGKESGWRTWLRAEITRFRPDVVIAFGCERLRHSQARRMCLRREIPFLSLEEGYVRPGYIAVEWGGNNRRSPIAKAGPGQIERWASEPVAAPASGHAFNAMARYGFMYYILRSVGWMSYPYVNHHKARPLVREALFWIRSAWRKVSRFLKNKAIVEDLLENHRDEFYLVPLQVRDDMQLLRSSRHWSNEGLIAHAIASFAEHAPTHRRLVFKVHPLERGHSDALERIGKLARAHGVADRVHGIDDGSIGVLARSTAGMLTINSTSAWSAMFRQVPLGVLGEAMFRRPELAFCIETKDDLDRFWTEATPAPFATTNAFRRAMMSSTLKPGDFYLRSNRRLAVQSVKSRLYDLVDASKDHPIHDIGPNYEDGTVVALNARRQAGP